MKKLFSTLLKKDNKSALDAHLQWIAELSKQEATDRLKLSLQRIATLLNDASFSPTDKLLIIFSLDESNISVVQRQFEDFSKSDLLPPDIHHQIIDTNYAYHRILFLAYFKLIDQIFHRAPDQQPSNHAKLKLLTRALHSGICMLRWRQFEYAPQPANIWKQAHTLFALADQNLLLKQPTTVYDGQAVTSIQALYVHLHMLGGLNYSNLNKAQLNLVSKLLQRWSLSVKTSHQMEHYHTFFTPLDKDKPAERIRKKTPLTPSLFWDLDEIEYDIQHNIQCLQMRKSPPLLQFIKINNQKLLLESLQFLQREWSKKHYVRQRRKESRRQSNKYISVTIGISEILQLLKRYNLEEDSVRSLMDGTLNDRRLPTSVVMRGPINTLLVGKEKWNIVDESQQGLGSLIPESLNQHIKLNKLVAIVSNYSDAKPAITAVRNIKQMTEGKVKIGLEILTEKPKLAVLRKLDLRKQDDVSAQSSLTPAFSLDSNSSYAIYIPQSSMLDRPASIIMSKLDHVANSLYEVSFQQSREVIKMTDPIEIGDDWVRISFPDINKQRKTI